MEVCICYQMQNTAWTILQFEYLCSHIRLTSSGNVNIVEWLVSVPAVRLFVDSALTISFPLASRGYTFDRSAFNVLFQKV